MADAIPAAALEVSRDDALKEMLARKDARAAGWLFDTYEADVNRIVWSILGGDKEHDDIVHDAMCSILKGAWRVENPARLKAWVRTVTVNEVRMALRRRRLSRIFGSLDDDPQGERFAALVPDEAQREAMRRLYRSLTALTADERSVLVLRHIEQLELTEVAEAVGRSLATIKRWLRRAEDKLKLEWHRGTP